MSGYSWYPDIRRLWSASGARRPGPAVRLSGAAGRACPARRDDAGLLELGERDGVHLDEVSRVVGRTRRVVPITRQLHLHVVSLRGISHTYRRQTLANRT